MTTAAKLKTTAEAALEKWDKNFQKILKLTKERDGKLEKERSKYDRACESVMAECDDAIRPLVAHNKTLESQIEQSLTAGITADKQTVAVPRIETAMAVAEIKDSGRREIDPRLFFREVPVADRTSIFWSCVSILIGPAEKFLPEEAMKRLARHSPKYSVVVRAKQ